jgi:Ca-activated chloride channel family protein
MLHFANPPFLLLLLALPLLVGWRLRQRRRAVPHPSLGLFASLPLARARVAEHGGLVLRTLALALLILALAQPRTPDLRTRLDTDGLAIMLVLDVSGSMGERDFDGPTEKIPRLDAVKRVLRLFVAGNASGETLPEASFASFEGRPTDLLGLVCFATRPEVVCPLTLEHATLLRLLDAEEARGVPGESETNLSDAIALGLARLRGAGPRRKVLVLLTDGEHNQTETRSTWTPVQAAQVAKSLGIALYAIDAGTTPTGDASPREETVTRLNELAQLTGGRYFAASDTHALITACATIDRLERTPIASFQYRRYHEAYPWIGLAAFVLFVSAMVLEQTLWRRLP